MLRILFFLLLLPRLSTGQIPKAKSNTYINDYTSKLTESEIYTLNEQLLQLEKQSTVQIAVLLIHHLPPDMSLEEYARAVGNNWKVGKAYNGIVYVAVLGKRRQRLEIARNLEGVLPDITAATIIDNLRPYLIQEQYYAALQLLISQIVHHLGYEAMPVSAPVETQTYDSSYYLPLPEVTSSMESTTRLEREAYEKKKAQYEGYGHIALGCIVMGFTFFCIWAWRYRRKYRRANTINGVYIGVGSSYFTSTYGSSTGSSGGGGSSGFGGFGGSGGGGFSGGGASGSW